MEGKQIPVSSPKFADKMKRRTKILIKREMHQDYRQNKDVCGKVCKTCSYISGKKRRVSGKFVIWCMWRYQKMIKRYNIEKEREKKMVVRIFF